MSYLREAISNSFELCEATNNKTIKTVLVALTGKNYRDKNILSSYCIHHLNHNKKDNDLSNICLVNSSQHASYHNKVRNIVRRATNNWEVNITDREILDDLKREFFEVCTDSFTLDSLIKSVKNTPDIEDEKDESKKSTI